MALPPILRRNFEWHVPADQLAAEVIEWTLTGCASRTAPPGEATVVGHARSRLGRPL